jgi:hypothetical protein
MSQTESLEPTRDDLRFWEILAFCAYILGLFAIGMYAWGEGGVRVFGILWVVGTAAWMAGSALGFLFGVPRVRAAQGGIDAIAVQASIVPNTNLEQISDWLTKIIVGATLVQLGPLVKSIGELSVFIGHSLGKPTNAIDGASVSGGVLILFFTAGFIWGYLWCSLRVFREMQSLIQRERRVRGNETGGIAQPPGGSRND